MRIDHVHLAKLDLNLLVALDALLSERSVTRAALVIGISQSAMSHALSRLRTTFADELLTRVPDGMRPTPRALGLLAPVRAALAQIQELTAAQATFDPATADATRRTNGIDGPPDDPGRPGSPTATEVSA